MKDNDFWIQRFRDNRLRGVLQELRQVIDDCDDSITLHKLRSTLHLGFSNFAGNKSDELNAAAPHWSVSKNQLARNKQERAK